MFGWNVHREEEEEGKEKKKKKRHAPQATSLPLRLAFSFSPPQTSTLLRLTMDKSGTVKSNYEEKLHSCPRNHLCQRPHNETQGLLK